MKKPKTLTGAIKGITEDQAALIQKQLPYLATNVLLKEILQVLKRIEKGLKTK